MSDAVIQTILQVFGGGLMGFLIARYTVGQQKLQKYIAYKTGKIRLLHRHDKTPELIKVSVDKSLITGNVEDSGKDLQINSAVAHSVILKNKGNSTAEDVHFDIIFNKDINILSYTSKPVPSKSYKMKIERVIGEKNVLRIFLPYLNSNRTINLSIVATADDNDSDPKIIGIGKDVEVSEFKKESIFPAYIIAFLAILIIYTMFEGNLVKDSFGSIIPVSWISILGGKVETVDVTVASFSTAHKIIAVVGGIILSLVAFQRFKKRINSEKI